METNEQIEKFKKDIKDNSIVTAVFLIVTVMLVLFKVPVGWKILTGSLTLVGFFSIVNAINKKKAVREGTLADSETTLNAPERFYSITLLNREQKYSFWKGNIEKSTYRVNEVLLHDYDEKAMDNKVKITYILIYLLIGILLSFVFFIITKEEFFSKEFFVIIGIGIIGGGFAAEMKIKKATRFLIAKEGRSAKGYSSGYALIKEEDWKSFSDSLKKYGK